MDDLPAGWLAKSKDAILDLTKCAVCLKTLRREFSQCGNGHVVCTVCLPTAPNDAGRHRYMTTPLSYQGHTSYPSCPTCKQQMVYGRNNSFLNKIIEALPRRCKHPQCPVYLHPDDDHEIYCGWQKVECKLCDTYETGKDMLTHVLTHKYVNICGTDTKSLCSYMRQNVKIGLPVLSLVRTTDQKKVSYSPAFVFEQFLWIEVLKERSTERVLLTFFPVPNGTKPKEIYAKIHYSSVNSDDETQFTTSIKLNLNPKCANENKVQISGNRMPWFNNDKEAIPVHITYTQK